MYCSDCAASCKEPPPTALAPCVGRRRPRLARRRQPPPVRLAQWRGAARGPACGVRQPRRGAPPCEAARSLPALHACPGFAHGQPCSLWCTRPFSHCIQPCLAWCALRHCVPVRSPPRPLHARHNPTARHARGRDILTRAPAAAPPPSTPASPLCLGQRTLPLLPAPWQVGGHAEGKLWAGSDAPRSPSQSGAARRTRRSPPAPAALGSPAATSPHSPQVGLHVLECARLSLAHALSGQLWASPPAPHLACAAHLSLFHSHPNPPTHRSARVARRSCRRVWRARPAPRPRRGRQRSPARALACPPTAVPARPRLQLQQLLLLRLCQAWLRSRRTGPPASRTGVTAWANCRLLARSRPGQSSRTRSIYDVMARCGLQGRNVSLSASVCRCADCWGFARGHLLA
jgi:hypothetical protein